MNNWLCCKYGHVFHPVAGPQTPNGTPICPRCQVTESMSVPVAVVESVKQFAQRRGVETRSILNETNYYASMGCFGFSLEGVFYGVESDGYLHS
jgi:hypothetical protein